MATGENFIRIHSARRDAEKRERDRVKVDKMTEQRINAEIKKLQNDRDLLYQDDDISDEELNIKSRELTEKINKLIDSMY